MANKQTQTQRSEGGGLENCLGTIAKYLTSKTKQNKLILRGPVTKSTGKASTGWHPPSKNPGHVPWSAVAWAP